MLNETTAKQLRDIIQEEINFVLEELSSQKLDTDEKGVTTHTLKSNGKNAGYVKTKDNVMVGRIRPTKPLKKDTVEEIVKAPPSGDEDSPDTEPEKKPRKKKDNRSKEDKSRDIGQIEMFEGKRTLAEWKRVLTEKVKGTK